jgi:haloalkane dehalogenase
MSKYIRVMMLAGAALLSSTMAEAKSKAGPESAACKAELKVMKTADGTEFVRTPDACFAGLPDWNFKPRYVTIDGLRQAYVDEGPRNGKVILMLHGQPSWSYLHRFMIRDLSKMGYRVIAMDNLGFGRSDKPVSMDYHTFQTQLKRTVGFMDALKLQKINLFGQDWGSLIGLYAAGGDLQRFDRIMIGNGGLAEFNDKADIPKDKAATDPFHQMLMIVPPKQPPFFDENGKLLLPPPPSGSGKVEDAFGQWIGYSMHDERFKPSLFLEALTYDALTPGERAAYDAPFPSRLAMAGPRKYPAMRNDLSGIARARMDALETYQRPFITIFGGNDPGLIGEGDARNWMHNKIPGAKGQPHHTFRDASHFVQDDKGPEIAKLIDAFIKANP